MKEKQKHNSYWKYFVFFARTFKNSLSVKMTNNFLFNLFHKTYGCQTFMFIYSGDNKAD